MHELNILTPLSLARLLVSGSRLSKIEKHNINLDIFTPFFGSDFRIVQRLIRNEY